MNELKEILLDKLREAPAQGIAEAVVTGATFAALVGLFAIVILAFYLQSCYC